MFLVVTELYISCVSLSLKRYVSVISEVAMTRYHVTFFLEQIDIHIFLILEY